MYSSVSIELLACHNLKANFVLFKYIFSRVGLAVTSSTLAVIVILSYQMTTTLICHRPERKKTVCGVKEVSGCQTQMDHLGKNC